MEVPLRGGSLSPVGGSAVGRRKILGKYEIGKTLGEGRFGKVKFGVHLESGLKVAIKKLNKQKVIESGMITKVKQEIAIMKQIHHPHVVSLLEVLASATHIYMVLEFVPGGELFHTLASVGRFEESTARMYFQQLIATLSYVHSLGICHRDLKPENLLMDERGNLKISDFGLSSLQSPEALCHTRCGTQNYVAPEVLVDDYAGYDGFKADVWSCGVILFVFLAGFLPFDEPTADGLCAKIREGLSTFPKRFSPAACDLLSRVFVPDPAARISTADIQQHPWFLHNYHPDQPPPVDLAQLDHTWQKVSDYRSDELVPFHVNGLPVTNAFELIALSGALDLTLLLKANVPEMSFQTHTRFPTRAAPDVILRKLQEEFKKRPVSVKLYQHQAKMDLTAFSAYGALRFEILVLYVASDLRMVVFKRKSGDIFEFYRLYKEIALNLTSLTSDLPPSALSPIRLPLSPSSSPPTEPHPIASSSLDDSISPLKSPSFPTSALPQALLRPPSSDDFDPIEER